MLETTPYQRRRAAESLLSSRFYTARELGKRLHVSQRTARRIINELSCFLPVIENDRFEYRITK